MKKLNFIFLLFIVSSFSFAKANLSFEQELAIYYYAVGQRYEELGLSKKAIAFKKRALSFYPNLEKEFDVKNLDSYITFNDAINVIDQIQEKDLIDLPQIKHKDNVKINESTNAPEIAYIKKGLINYETLLKLTFNKFTRALITNNQEVLSSLLADTVSFNGEKISKKDLLIKINNMYESLKSVFEFSSVDDIYKLNTLKVNKKSDNLWQINIEKIDSEISKALNFKSKEQNINFLKEDEKFFISSIN